MSTGIGQGIAIPHGKTDQLQDLCGVLGISRSGIEYDALDGKPVHVVFLLLAPLDSAGPHIRALQQIATLMKDAGFSQRLREAKSAGEIFRIMQNEENRLELELG
jgi:PTS system nitrogen regulatory IIA component